MDVWCWYNLYLMKKVKQRRFWTSGVYSLNKTKNSHFLPFFKYWCGVLLLLVWFCCLLELLTGQPRSGCSRCSCLALMIRPQEIFLKGHDDFTYKIITPWMKLFIHFYTNRWICTIWETSKERKHCQDQEGGFSKYFLLYILIIDHFYIALLSALKKTHCAVVACDSEWVTVCSLNIIGRLSGSRATNIYFSSYILHNDL